MVQDTSRIDRVEGVVAEGQLLSNAHDTLQSIGHAEGLAQGGRAARLADHGSQEPGFTGTGQQKLDGMVALASDLQYAFAFQRREMVVGVPLGRAVVDRIEPDAVGFGKRGSPGRPIVSHASHGLVARRLPDPLRLVSSRLVVVGHLRVGLGIGWGTQVDRVFRRRRPEHLRCKQDRNAFDHRVCAGQVLADKQCFRRPERGCDVIGSFDVGPQGAKLTPELDLSRRE